MYNAVRCKPRTDGNETLRTTTARGSVDGIADEQRTKLFSALHTLAVCVRVLSTMRRLAGLTGLGLLPLLTLSLLLLLLLLLMHLLLFDVYIWAMDAFLPHVNTTFLRVCASHVRRQFVRIRPQSPKCFLNSIFTCRNPGSTLA